jgi:hypothetical protein
MFFKKKSNEALTLEEATKQMFDCKNWEKDAGKLSKLQSIVAAALKERREGYEKETLFLLSTSSEGSCAGCPPLFSAVSKIAIEKVNAPETCPKAQSGQCSLASRACAFDTPEYYPFCPFMQSKFVHEAEWAKSLGAVVFEWNDSFE